MSPGSETLTWRGMCEVVAEYLNKTKLDGRTDWTGLEVWNSSPSGEVGWIPGAYEKAKALLEEEDGIA